MNNSPYSLAQEAWVKMVNLKEGDTVRVLTTAKTHQYGWCNSWVPKMDLSVGKEHMVSRIFDNAGIRLYDSYTYPFFVLEKVAETLPQPIKISDSYKAEFQKDGGIKVGCQNISFDLLKEIYETAAKIKNDQ